MKRQTYSSPMSFVGSTRRLSGWSRRHGWWAWLLAIPAMLAMWTFLVGWYLIVFGVFGIVTVPMRFFRRGQRKSLAVQQAQLEEIRKLSAGSPQ